VGGDRATALRSSLEQLVRRFDLELPHYPVGYGPADHGATGGGAQWGRGALSFDPEAELRAAARREAESDGRIDVRNHGQDWSPVPRGDGDTVSGLSLTALTSEALMAFTIDFEACGGLSLAYVADLLRHIGDDGVDIRLRPARGVAATGELPVHWAFAGLKRHGYAVVESESTDRRSGGPFSHRERETGPRHLHSRRGCGRKEVGATVRRLGRAIPPCGPYQRHRTHRGLSASPRPFADDGP
jgi:hypothetical protein